MKNEEGNTYEKIMNLTPSEIDKMRPDKRQEMYLSFLKNKKTKRFRHFVHCMLFVPLFTTYNSFLNF